MNLTEPTENPVEIEIKAVCAELGSMLIEKNRAYGNSALDPVRIFSKASTQEQIKVRLDDKLSRLARGRADAFGEDVINDLMGYLVLLRVHERMAPKQVITRDIDE